MLFHLLVAQMFGFGTSFFATRYAAFHVRINEYTVRILVAKNIIGASSYNNAVRFICKRVYYFALRTVYRLNLSYIILIERRKRLSYCNGIKRMRLFFQNLRNVLFGKGSVLCYCRKNFFVIVFYAEFFRKSASEFSSAATEFSSYCNDSAHGRLLFSVY